MTLDAVFAEPGRNLDLSGTFDIVLSQCQRVTAFGPYQICEQLYCRARNHKERLERGEVRYTTTDVVRNTNRVSNCIHALTVFNRENPRLRIGRTNYGVVASYYVTESYWDWIVCPKQVHDWVADLLGLERYPINWRRLEQGPPRRRELHESK